MTDLWCGLQWIIEPDDTFEGLADGALQDLHCTLDTAKPDLATSSGSVTLYDGVSVDRKHSDLPDANPAAFSTSNFHKASCYDSGHAWTSNWM